MSANAVYIAGPMSGLPEFNYPAFALAASLWRANGYEVLNPAENFMGDTSREYREYIRADLDMLLKADAIALLPGWQQSRGARYELHTAQLLNLPVYDAESQLPIDPPAVATLVTPVAIEDAVSRRYA